MRKLLYLSIFVSATFLFLSSFNQKQTAKSKVVTPHFQTTKMDTITWKFLGMVKFTKKTDPNYGEVMFPVVSPLLKQKHNKKVAISGFIVPIDSESYALSKNVFAACFFCGAAGPETIVGLKFKGKTPRLKTDQYVTIVGELKINENDPDDWIYNMENTVIVKGL